jgi:hypothetical protein
MCTRSEQERNTCDKLQQSCDDGCCLVTSYLCEKTLEVHPDHVVIALQDWCDKTFHHEGDDKRRLLTRAKAFLFLQDQVKVRSTVFAMYVRSSSDITLPTYPHNLRLDKRVSLSLRTICVGVQCEDTTESVYLTLLKGLVDFQKSERRKGRCTWTEPLRKDPNIEMFTKLFVKTRSKRRME